MPIPVVCDNCQTRLNAPDAAAGKKVKCPKCQTVMPVPGAAEPAPPPPPRRPAPEPPPESPPAPPAGAAFDFGAAVSSASEPKARGDRPRRDDDRPRRRDDDDDAPRSRRPRDEESDDRPRRPRPRDEESDDDDRPRRRPERGGEKKSMGPLLLIGGAFLLLTCCGGGGFGVYYGIGKVREAAEQKRAELDALEKRIADEKKKQAGGGTAGWKTFEAPDKSFRASFPSAAPGDDQFDYEAPSVQSVKAYQAMGADGSVVCVVAVIKFKSGSKAADRERDLKAGAGLIRFAAEPGAQPRTVDWLGGKAQEAESRSTISPELTVVTRSILIGNTGYLAQVQHRSKPDAAATFFNSFEALSK